MAVLTDKVEKLGGCSTGDGLPDGSGKPVKRREKDRCEVWGMRYVEKELPLRTCSGQPEQVLRNGWDDESPKESEIMD